MTFIFWLQFATVCVAGAMSPGPSLALIIRNSITISRFAGFMTAIGHGIGMGVYAVFAVTGLIIILTTNEILFQFIQIIGILFLLFIGFQFLFKKNQEKTLLKVKISKNSREKPQNSRKKLKTQGKNSSSRSFDARPGSKLVFKKMPVLCTI